MYIVVTYMTDKGLTRGFRSIGYLSKKSTGYVVSRSDNTGYQVLKSFIFVPDDVTSMSLVGSPMALAHSLDSD